MRLLTNPLSLLPPETAHSVALGFASTGLVPSAPADSPGLKRQLLGKTFRNPIGLSAGADKEAAALIGWEKMGFGFVEAGTVTPKERPGNPGPRIWRIGQDDSLVNWLGLPGRGMDYFLNNLRQYRARVEQKLVVGVSIAAPDGGLADFSMLAAATAPLADYLTLNASCPNVTHGEGDHDPAADMAAQVKAVTSAADGTPLLVKLGPTNDRDSFVHMVTRALEAGAAGIVATNTVPPDRTDLIPNADFVWPKHDGQAVGGYSGPLLLDIACNMVAWARDAGGPEMPLMGVGGVQSGEDAKRLVDAGADVIQLYTALTYQGPKVLRHIKHRLLADN
ncbi:MAG: dihydroorotate dehydrogenase (quinone) [Alphaproteobacteria bacterium]|nr:dihydroorotate dehydrogenase (quinone) [Alphaproteobacteria bacterium SS10]